MVLPRFLTSLLVVSFAAVGAGCELNSSNLLHVFATHHATPQDGSFPNLGDGSRVFYTDQDWRITLTEAYVVTSHVQLQSCAGDVIDLDLHSGPLPEDLREPDLENYSLGGAEVPGESYCRLLVHYGPYVPVTDSSTRQFSRPESDAIYGATLYLAGLAEKGREEVQFQFRSDEPLVAAVDLSTLDDGKPVHVDPSSLYPVELTTSKTYDRFLDGIDFMTMMVSDVEADLVLPLADETRVGLGSRLVIQ